MLECTWTHSQQRQTESQNGRKTISFLQVTSSAATYCRFCLPACDCACQSACVSACVQKTQKLHQPACAVPPFILPSVSSLHLTAYTHVPDHICVCVVSLFVTLIGIRQCKHPFLPIRQNSAVMLRDDKPFCGASWRRGCSPPRALEVTGTIAALRAPPRRDTPTWAEQWINLPVSPGGSKTNTQGLVLT